MDFGGRSYYAASGRPGAARSPRGELDAVRASGSGNPEAP